jgi:hypothetical protein
VVNRRGESRIGCLLPILLLALAAYFAVDFGEAWFRFWQFKDAMGRRRDSRATRPTPRSRRASRHLPTPPASTRRGADHH